MSFKNAIKLLVSKFGLVWTILLYVLVFTGVIACLAVTFVIPVYRSFLEAGVGTQVSGLFNSIVGGAPIGSWFEQIKGIFDTIGNVLSTDFSAFLNSTLLLVLVLGLAGRFLVGLYELPLVAVLEASMSSDAKIGFTGCFIAKLGVSCRFVLCKMIYTILYDVAMYGILYAMFGLFSVKGFGFFAPFAITLVFLLLNAFRYSVISMWAPAVVVGKRGIFPALSYAMQKTFRTFGSVYSSFLISWVMIIALNVLVGLFTFGVGLLVTIPLSMVFISMLNMTIFYTKTGRRFYVDSAIVYPRGVQKD